MKFFHRHSIRDRLFSAFGVLSALTLITSFVGWSLHNHIGDHLSSVVHKEIPTLTTMVALSKQAATITSLAPALIVVTNAEDRERVWQQLETNSAAISRLLPTIPTTLPPDGDKKNLTYQLTAILSSMSELNDNVIKRLAINSEKQAENQRLRWAAGAFLAEINPLIDHTLQHIRSRFNEDIPASGIIYESRSERPITQINKDLQLLYRIKADTSLLVNSIERASYLPDPDSLIATAIQAEEVVHNITQYASQLRNISGFAQVKNSVDHLLSFVQRDYNMFEMRLVERLHTEAGDAVLNKIKGQLSAFNQLIEAQVEATNSASALAVSATNQAINRGKILMFTAAGTSILMALLIVWLYVARHIVGRIEALDYSMRIIAAGNLNQRVPVVGNDEIGAMANSLRSFRDQLREKQAELVQAGKLAALGQLSAGISHEVNQPLSAIGHYAHNGSKLLARGRIDAALANFEQISQLTKRATEIITRLKSMARKRQNIIQPVCLNQVVEHVLTLLKSHPQMKSTEISLHMGDKKNVVLAEQIQLEQVVLNLINNALDAVADKSTMTDEKTRPNVITIKCCHNANQVDLRVCDNGPGIAPELYEQIFNPFFTTKEVDQGLGLGLSISYNIVQDFGGQLTIEHKPQRGATFCLQLPRYDTQNDTYTTETLT